MERSAFLQTVAAFAAAPHFTPIDPIGSIESKYRGLRLGVFAIDLRTGTTMQHRPDERFPMASTVKLPVVMAALHRVDIGKDRLDRKIRFSKSELARYYSRIADAYPNGGALPLADICRYTISDSDNTGVDLLFRELGGPAAVERYVRSLGFHEFNINRRERELPNSASANELRDTVTPRAMANLLRLLAVKSPLAPRTTALLEHAMLATTTGGTRLRAGVPHGWRVADKTGTYHNAANDAVLLFAPHAAATIAVAVYAFGVSTDAGSAAIADVARVLTAKL